jgi:hypothetical protein
LTRVKAQLFVIIEHCVHTLNPESIDRPIEQDPVSFWRLIFTAVKHQFGKYTVYPFSCLGIYVTVQLVHGNRLRIKDMGVHLGEALLLLQSCHGMLEHLVVHGLASSSGSDNHETVAYLNSVVELENLLDKESNFLNVVVSTAVADLGLEIAIVHLRSFKTWEQIQNDVFE